MIGLVDEPAQQSIIKAMEPLAKLWRSLEQKSPQSLRVGIARQPCQVLKGAIAPQQGCGFQTIQAQDHRIKQTQEHLRETVAATQTEVFEVSRQEIPQLQHSNEFVKEHDAAVMLQPPVIPSNF